jgi:hypothetical protein
MGLLKVVNMMSDRKFEKVVLGIMREKNGEGNGEYCVIQSSFIFNPQ